MLKHKTNVKTRDVKVVSRNIEILFLDDVEPLVLELPSADEIALLRDGYEFKISYPEIAKTDNFNLKEKYQHEIDRLLEKYEKYEHSPSYLVGLSNLSELVGNDEDVAKYLTQAEEKDESTYIKHEIGDNLIKRGLVNDAQKYFSSLDLNEDLYANLRLAYFSTVNSDMDAAEAFVSKALEIDELSYSARLFFGAICLWKRNFEQAVLNYKIATETNPYSSVGFLNLAAAYWGLGLGEKARFALKRSIILDPYSENAVSFFSDVTHLLKKDNDSIPVLNKYLKYDQKSERIWSLLGRAYYTLGRDNRDRTVLLESLSALRHQESLSSTYSAWNNLGLVAWELRDFSASRRYLNLSLKKAIEDHNDIALPLYNVCGLLIENKNYSNALQIMESCINLIEPDSDTYNLLDKIRLQHVVLLEGEHQRPKALGFAIEYLGVCKNIEVRLDLLIRVVYYHTVYTPDIGIIDQYRKDIFDLLDSIDNTTIDFSELKARAINNLVFAYLNFEMLDEANELINKMSSSFHKEPYATATLGMFNIKKGRYDKGVELYEEAITLLQDRKAKRRFRQRLNYELGKAYLKDGNIRPALRYLKKAVEDKDGYSYVKKDAKILIRNNMLLGRGS
ncbi:MAG: hypothetical protein ABW168_19785 [Sedimenticola sp.]